MTAYDAAMAIAVIGGMIWGALRGITWQLASIASLVLGYSVAHPLSGQLAPQFPGEPAVARALAMLVIYAGVSGGVFLAAWIVRSTLRRLQFEAFDRHLGMVLGGLEGSLLGLVATMFVVSLAPQLRDPIFRSPTGKVVGQVMGTLGPVLPDEIRTTLAPFWNQSDSPMARPEEVASERRDQVPVTPASTEEALSQVKDVIEKGEATVGKAIADAAKKEFEQQTGGLRGEVERR
jgi:membrane protein required for colicin V production